MQIHKTSHLRNELTSVLLNEVGDQLDHLSTAAAHVQLAHVCALYLQNVCVVVCCVCGVVWWWWYVWGVCVVWLCVLGVCGVSVSVRVSVSVSVSVCE